MGGHTYVATQANTRMYTAKQQQQQQQQQQQSKWPQLTCLVHLTPLLKGHCQHRGEGSVQLLVAVWGKVAVVEHNWGQLMEALHHISHSVHLCHSHAAWNGNGTLHKDTQRASLTNTLQCTSTDPQIMHTHTTDTRQVYGCGCGRGCGR